jgi:hypothetical protein
MKTPLRALITAVLLLGALRAIAQRQPSPPKTIPDSINYMWKMVESEFTSLAEAMPEEKWSFKPMQGAFTDVRTFAEQVKHVACANETWAKKLTERSRQTIATLVVRVRQGRRLRFWLTCASHSS